MMTSMTIILTKMTIITMTSVTERPLELTDGILRSCICGRNLLIRYTTINTEIAFASML